MPLRCRQDPEETKLELQSKWEAQGMSNQALLGPSLQQAWKVVLVEERAPRMLERLAILGHGPSLQDPRN